MFAKLEITGIIKSLTGMHIGGSSGFAAIGAVDSPVIRDAYSDDPMIPGSSLKGKMRSLLAKQYNSHDMVIKKAHDEDDIRILRLFGKGGKEPMASRLIFSDMIMKNGKELKEIGVQTTEIKFENTINRISAVANPRQIERSVRGGEYDFSLIYNVDVPEELLEDFTTIRDGMRLLEYDYLGGHGSRGYGKIAFDNLDVKCVIGEIAPGLLAQCCDIIKEV